MHYMPWSRLICDEKGRFLLAMVVADDHLHDDDNIGATTEHLTNRNASVKRMGYKLTG